MKKHIYMLLASLATLLVYACGNIDNPKKVTIAGVNWAEGVAITQLSKALLEKEGYTVEIKNADVAPVFAAVSSGDADVFLDAWLPVTHKEYLDRFGANLEILGTGFKSTRIGLVVPEYVQANDINALLVNPSYFKGKIIGIDAGAGIMNKAEQAIDAYGLKLKLQASSEAAMLTALKKRIDARQPVVITGWLPHYMFSMYKLKFLDDPKGVFGKEEHIQTIANRRFVQSRPQLAAFFRHLQLDEAELGSLMAELEQNSNEQAAVKHWLDEHQDFARRMVAFLKTDA